MAEANGGFGGFRQVPMGFDKNQVNEYITDLRKKMLAMEADMKANNEKMEECQKLADEAEDRIKAAVAVESDKVSELTMQLNREKERGDNFTAKVNQLKQQLEDEKKKMTDMLKSGKGVSAEAQKAYTEVMEKANADAEEIIADAKAKAAQILSEAESAKAEATEKLEAFLEALRTQVDTINTSYKAVSSSASELLGASAPAIAVPEFKKVAIEKPVAVAPVVEAVEEVAEKISEPVAQNNDEAESSGSLEDLMAQLEAVESAAESAEPVAEESAADSLEDIMSALEAVAAPEPEKPAEDEGMPSIDKKAKSDSAPAVFEDAWGGSELAQTIYNSEMNGGVPLVNPDAKDIFGQDLFGMGLDMSEESNDDMSSDIGGFDLNDDVGDIQPLDTSDYSEAAFNKGFDNELLAQTMHSSSLSNDADEDLLAAVKAAEAAFEVKPSISMDEDEEPELSTEEDLMQSLRDAEAALNNIAGGSLSGNVDSVSGGASDDMWADLQKQLDAMQLAGDTSFDEPVQQAEPVAVPEAPSADDSSIWDLGGATESSDDDDMMSGDFGGFGF